MIRANHAHLQKAAVAACVLALHAAVLFLLLSVGRIIFFSPPQERALTWIVLPPLSEPVYRPMAPMNVAPRVAVLTMPEVRLNTPPPPNAITLPPASEIPPPQVLVSLGQFLHCDYENYGRLTKDERARCPLDLSVPNLATPYVFTADQTAKFAAWTAYQKDRSPPGPAGIIVATCTWENGLCGTNPNALLGCGDPEKKSNLGIEEHLDVVENLTLQAGYMMDSGGCSGTFRIGLTYRW